MSAIEQRLARAIRYLERANRESEAEAAKRNPPRHAKTLVMQKGKPASYRYRPDASDRRVHWCWSCWRNAAGFFLAWREVESPDEIKRDMFGAFRTRKAAKAWATGEATRKG